MNMLKRLGAVCALMSAVAAVMLVVRISKGG